MSVKATLSFSARLARVTAELLKDFKMPLELHKEMKVGDLTFTLQSKWGQGDLCDLYEVTYETPQEAHDPGGSRFDRILNEEDGSSTRGFLKVSTDYLDNDLVEHEGEMLRRLYPRNAKEEKFFRYLPKPLGVFNLSLDKQLHACVLLPFLENYVSVSEVLTAYPTGLPSWEDAVWMLNRVMEGVGFVHTNSIVHGAIIPEHVMLLPSIHGAKLIDWSYSTTCDDRSEARVRAMVRSRGEYSAPEILSRERVNPSTDMFSIGKLGIALLGGDTRTLVMPTSVPMPVQNFLVECVDSVRSKRPRNAWDARDDFEKIVVSIVGKRKFRPFVMPTK